MADRPDPSIACIGAGYWGKSLVRDFQKLGALGWVCEMILTGVPTC